MAEKRWHISSNGEPAVCKADKVGCPLKPAEGADSVPHFSSYEEAKVHSEEVLEGQSKHSGRYHTTREVISVTYEGGAPIPQANSLPKVFASAEMIGEGISTPQGIAKVLGMSERQGWYYADSLVYLGLAEKHQEDGFTEYSLSEAGRRYLDTEPVKRQQLFAVLLESDGFVDYYLSNNRNKEDLAEYMMSLDGSLNETTASRRASTIASWADSLEVFNDDAEKQVGEARLKVGEVLDFEDSLKENHRKPKVSEVIHRVCNSCFMAIPASMDDCPDCFG